MCLSSKLIEPKDGVIVLLVEIRFFHRVVRKHFGDSRIGGCEHLCQDLLVQQFTIAKYWKQPKCPSANEWIQKLWYIYTMEFYAAERKKELIPFSTAWMKLESIMLSEISQEVRDKYHMISPLTGT